MQTKSALLISLLLAGFALSPASFAQSHQLGILAGAANPSASVGIGGSSITAGVTAAVQVDYAQRLKQTSGGDLFLELPLTRAFKASVGVTSSHVDVTQSQFFFTPGLRYVIAPKSVVSPYGVAGFGFGWFDSVHVSFDGPFSARALEGFKPAAAFGGGLQIRIARGFVFRAEVRDFVNCATDAPSRNHVVFNGGFGFRF